MTRRSAWCALLGAVLLSACTPGVGDEPPHPVNRIILISIDTLRADRLGAYGYARPTSPVLDAFAADGVLFARCSASSPWTPPSHTSMLTGLYPSRHGVFEVGRELRAGVRTLAEEFGARGFRTAAVVASDLVLPCKRCKSTFEHYDEIEWERKDGRSGPRVLNRAADINAAALAWLGGLPPEAPFFLLLHYYDVHSDYAPEPRFARMFGAGPDLEPGETDSLIATRQGRTMQPHEVEQIQRLYDAEIRQLDTRLGELFDELVRRGIWEDALIVVTSDHGEEFREHGGFLHGRTLYEEVLHVPLIVRGPGIPAGRVVDAMVSLADIMPTMLALARVPVPDGLDGHALLPLLADGAAVWPELVLSEADHFNERQAIRAGQYKLIRSKSADDELYDLAADPGEHDNLADRERARSADLAGRMRGVLAGRSPARVRPLTEVERARLRVLGYVD